MLRCQVVDVEDQPVEGVAVSDGVEVATTGSDGTAALPHASGRPFVWVSRPTGFDCDRWFVPRDEITADEVRFVLVPVDQPLPVTFAQVTDLHVSDLAEPERVPLADSLYGFDGEGRLVDRPLTGVDELAGVLAEVANAAGPHGPPRFVVATGDLTDHGKSTEFELLHRAVDTSPIPVHLVPGNHDHYGHLHEPDPDDAPVDSEGMGTGTTHRYERHVGPRWWSLTHAGLRIVALDWFSHRLRLDRDDQEAWLAADLTTAAAGTPVLFLTHDQMPADFFARVAATSPHVRLLGSLSGHWHTSRVVRIDGLVHANTGNATFGSFDWAPAHARLVGWDGEDLSFRTVAIGGGERLSSATFAAAGGPPLGADLARWTVRLPGAVHLARPILVGDESVVVAWSDDDAASGGLVCHDAATGTVRWRAPLDGPVRAGPTWLADAGLVVAVSVSGGVRAVDAATGEVRWSAQVREPTMAWVHGAPVPLPDGAVAVGEVRCFAALDLADGSVRWERTDIDAAENTATPMQGVVQDGVLVVGFSLMSNHTVGLDPATGATRWTADGNKLHSPSSDLVPDPEGTDLYLTRLGGRVERVSAATGERVWAARVPAAFATGRPLVADGSVVVTSALGTVHRLDATTGEERWHAQLPGDRLLAMGPYRRSGLAVPAGSALVGDAVVQGTGDGRVHRVDLATGSVSEVADLGGPITVPVLPVGPDVVVATAEGTLARIPL